MKKLPREEEEGSIEIISVGALYNGSWHKKYWSSSRGKDRYPYPVGYKAVRAYRGNKYKVEIEEGSTGPLFLITDSDGRSSSGPTPDIALDNFRKAGRSGFKILNKKRYSCQMEGAEFFGFKTPVIKRLIRELMMNVSRMAEVDFSSSNSCTRASIGDQDRLNEDKSIKSISETTLAVPSDLSKRNEKATVTYVRLRQGQSKRARSEKLLLGADALNTIDATPIVHNLNAIPFDASDVEEKASLLDNNVYNARKNHLFFSGCEQNGKDLSKECSPSALTICKTGLVEPSESCKTMPAPTTLSEGLFETVDKEPRVALEGRVQHDEVSEGDKKLSALTIRYDESNQRMEDKQTAIPMVTSRDIAAISHSEDGASLHRNIISQKNDHNFADKDISKSMMTLLLPQAIPLLKEKTLGEEELVLDSMEEDAFGLTNMRIARDGSGFEGFKCGVLPKTCIKQERIMQYQTVDADVMTANHLIAIAPDSLDGNQSEKDEPFFPDDEPGKSKEVHPLGDTQMDGKFQNDDANKLEAYTENLYRSLNASLEEIQEKFGNLSGSPPCMEKQCLEPEFGIAPDSLEGNSVHQIGGTDPPIYIKHNADALVIPSIRCHRDVKFNTQFSTNFDLLGCYFHPKPILSMLIHLKNNEIYIGVLCGSAIDNTQSLFVYKVVQEGQLKGNPFALGHTSIMFPCANDNTNRGVLAESSNIQFSSNGDYVVLLDTIKTPYCRDGKIDCSCSTCQSKCYEENAVKIVQIKHGYVSLVKKLKMVGSVSCILVCHPNSLIAVDKCSRITIWTMNMTWSAPDEEHFLPDNQSISPPVVELKRIPKTSHLVIGHNGIGEFFMWDIMRRIMISSFSTLGAPISQFYPVGLFTWRPIFSQYLMEGHIDGILAATRSWFSRDWIDDTLLPKEGEEIAVWLIVSTNSDPKVKHKSSISEHPRLALIVRKEAILGSAFNFRASAIGFFSGCGIIGTHEGHAYVWDLVSGSKFGTLHDFDGSGVSCIVAADSARGPLCIADKDGQLLVYQYSKNALSL